MARYHFSRPFVDSAGTLLTDATIRLYEPGTTTPITDVIYSAASGSSTRTQGWAATDGIIDFYLTRARRLRIGRTRSAVETYTEDVEIGAVINWMSNVRDYGAMGDGVTDDAAAIQAAMDDMPANGTLFFPAGTYIVGTALRYPDLDGVSLVGPPGGGTNRLPPATLRAKSSASLQAIMASQEWLTNGSSPDTGQGRTIANLGYYGGGFVPGRTITTAIETTAHTLHGLVVHGSGWLLDHVTVVSANGHGIYFPGVGVDGSTPIGESHEIGVEGCAVRWTGGDGIHVGPGQQDSWVQFCKIQYSGGHNIFADDMTPGWSFIHNHPSWAAHDSIHCESGWNLRIAFNYIGSIGEYMDGAAITHYAIYVATGSGQPAHIDHNAINTNTAGGQSDAVWGIRVSGWTLCTYNSLIYQTGDNIAGMVQTIGTPPAEAEDVGNHHRAA